MPAEGMYVPDDWKLRALFDERLKKRYSGKSSPYLRELVENDLSGKTSPDALSPNIVGELFTRLRPAQSAQMQAALEGVDQPMLLAKTLEALLIALERDTKWDEGWLTLLGAEDLFKVYFNAYHAKDHESVDILKAAAPNLAPMLRPLTPRSETVPVKPRADIHQPGKPEKKKQA